MMPGSEETQRNIEQIDVRIEPDYAPKFRSPSGRVLGMPDIDGKKKEFAPSSFCSRYAIRSSKIVKLGLYA